MRNAENREIDGHEWTTTQFPATEGLKLLTKLARLIGGPLGKAVGGLEGSGNLLDAKVDFSVVGEAISDLVTRLDEDEVVVLIKRLLKDTRCDGKEILPQFDLLFMGSYAMLFRVLAWVIGVNYKVPLADYLTGLKSARSVGEKSIQEVS